MRSVAKSLIPQLLPSTSKPDVIQPIFIDETLEQMPTLKVNEVHELSRFIPVVVLIPKLSLKGHTVRGKTTAKAFIDSAETCLLGVLDRAEEQPTGPDPGSESVFGDVAVNLPEMIVRRNGEPVALTAMEFKTLEYLVLNARRVISRTELLKEVWGYASYPRTRTVDNHLLRLRQKLEKDPSRPVHFQSVHGAGYKFLP